MTQNLTADVNEMTEAVVWAIQAMNPNSSKVQKNRQNDGKKNSDK
jgi:hypothetical protein